MTTTRSRRSQLSAVSLKFFGFPRLLAVLVTCHLSLVTSALAAPVPFDIPAQPAPAALDLFIKQSGAQVVYLQADVKDVQTNAVKGDYAPAAALEMLLKDTGLSSTEKKTGQFTVGRIPPKTSSVKGALVGEGGRGFANVLVTVRETGQGAETDRNGEYVFPKMAAGTYVLVATAPGYQPLHITDVQVRAGRDLVLGKEEMRKAGEGPLALEPFVVRADTVTELDPYEVTGSKVKPFSDGNVDIPRTINDTQPYYVYDSKTLESSGAGNLENFLKERLTMNTTALTNSQSSAAFAASVATGNTSSINLRGLGTDKTLILVNGRRMPSVAISLSEFQPDINGIPLSAIERVEVLPTSASGIYGSSALGGVINIILKRNYAGGEIRATYDNTFDTDSAVRTVSATYGTSLGKKTHLMVSGQWSDEHAMLIQDRRNILDANISRILSISPAFLYTSANPALGSLTNIASATANANLVLDNGTSLGSPITHVPAGTSGTTPIATLNAGLLANAGRYDLNFPPSRQHPYGLLRPIGATPETNSLQASVRHQLFRSLELFAEFRYFSNYAEASYDPTGAGSLTVLSTAAINPFNANVRVRVPVSVQDSSIITDSLNRSFSVGFNAQLPREWVAQGDYTWSRQDTATFSSLFDNAAVTAAFNSGALNPFVDALQFGLDLDRYLLRTFNVADQRLESGAVRAAGPLPALPWGAPRLATGLEYRRSDMVSNRAANEFQVFTFFPRWQVAKSIYSEFTLPLVKPERFPLLHALEAQVAGRVENFKVKTGTPSLFYLRTTPNNVVAGTPNQGGVPFFGSDEYTQTNYTIGLKYQPIRDVIIRASVANAFIPPTPAQLLDNPTQVNTTITFDPRDPTVTGTKIIPAVSGGNPDLKPQNSDSFNAGVIWQPATGWFRNLRLNLEYYKVTQHDFITPLSAQAIVNNESLFPGRVTRNAAGQITFIDIRQLNLFMRENSGFDVTADYYVKTGWGRFTFRGQHSTILTLKTQYAFLTPAYDGAGFPNDANGAIKHKTNATVGWERGNWAVNWTARHTPRYNQVGSPGGPSSVQNANGGVFVNGALTAQGSYSVASQTYHDAMVEYATRNLGETSGWRRVLLKDLTVQLGVRNVFDKVGPYDTQQSSNFYVSPYADVRLRSYWLSVRRAF
jgi:iron complex outermembrane receptor protein